MVPDTDGNSIPAFEIMHINNAIKGMIRDNKNYQIENAITAGRAEGMISMDAYLLKLYSEGKISADTLATYADHPEHMTRHIQK